MPVQVKGMLVTAIIVKRETIVPLENIEIFERMGITSFIIPVSHLLKTELRDVEAAIQPENTILAFRFQDKELSGS